jgi:hypothetical protein
MGHAGAREWCPIARAVQPVPPALSRPCAQKLPKLAFARAYERDVATTRVPRPPAITHRPAVSLPP